MFIKDLLIWIGVITRSSFHGFICELGQASELELNNENKRVSIVTECFYVWNWISMSDIRKPSTQIWAFILGTSYTKNVF